jgi:hypothetical protein
MIPLRPRELAGEEFQPEYISTLAQAQKVAQLASMERGINFITTLSTATNDPTLLRLIKPEETAREYLDFVAFNPKLIADEREYAAIQKEVADNNAAQMQQQNSAVQAETAKNLSQAELGKGSMLDTMMQAAAP